MSEQFENIPETESHEFASTQVEASVELASQIGDVALIFKNIAPEDRKFFEPVPEARRRASQNEGHNIIL